MRNLRPLLVRSKMCTELLHVGDQPQESPKKWLMAPKCGGILAKVGLALVTGAQMATRPGGQSLVSLTERAANRRYKGLFPAWHEAGEASPHVHSNSTGSCFRGFDSFPPRPGGVRAGGHLDLDFDGAPAGGGLRLRRAMRERAMPRRYPRRRLRRLPGRAQARRELRRSTSNLQQVGSFGSPRGGLLGEGSFVGLAPRVPGSLGGEAGGASVGRAARLRGLWVGAALGPGGQEPGGGAAGGWGGRRRRAAEAGPLTPAAARFPLLTPLLFLYLPSSRSAFAESMYQVSWPMWTEAGSRPKLQHFCW
jgi:hypothetical protein